VHPSFLRKSIAKALYHALFRILKHQGYIKLFAVITLPNNASIALHEALGFKKFSEYENVGFKLGKWQNVGWWELSLVDQPSTQPHSPVPFSKIKSSEIVNESLKNALSFLKN